MNEPDAAAGTPGGNAPRGALLPKTLLKEVLADLQKGALTDAAKVYALCPPEAGQLLIERLAASDPLVREQLAKMFYLARDYYRAAVVYEGLDAFEKAQAFYEQSGDLLGAADLALRTGRKAHAAELLERAGKYGDAARLYVEMGQRESATRAFQRSRRSAPVKDAAREFENLAPGEGAASTETLADYDFLQSTPLFESLTLPEIQSLYRICQKRRFAKGHVLIEQGRLGQALYLLSAGGVAVQQVTGNAVQEIARLAPGAYFGEMALLDPDSVTSARITATEDSEGFEITRERFLQLMKVDTPLEAKLYKVFVETLCQRLRDTTAELARLRTTP